MEHHTFCLVWSIKSVVLPKFQAKFGFKGSSTHDPAVCDVEAHRSVTALQTCVRKQPTSHHAYMGPNIKTSVTTSFRPHITRTFNFNPSACTK